MNLDQKYSKYFGNNLSPKGSPKNAAFKQFSKNQETGYQPSSWVRPSSNINSLGVVKKQNSAEAGRRFEYEQKLRTAERDQINYAHGREEQFKNHNDRGYKPKGISIITKYRTNSNDNKDREENESNAVLKNSQSQGQLNKRNPEKSRDYKKLAPSFSGRKLGGNIQRQQLSQYKKLYDRLDTIQNKLASAKVDLEKKKAEKEIAIEKSQKERKQKELEKEKKEHQKSQSKTSNSKQGSQNILKGIVTQVPKVNKQLHNFDHNPYSPRHNMYYVSEITRAYKELNSLARQHLQTSIQLLKIMNPARQAAGEFAREVLNLAQKPCYKDKKTVVFDLDQTLIHCNDTTQAPHDVVLPITFPTGEVIEAGINIRPYAQEILKALAANFQVIIFTASHSCYANVVLDYLDPTKSLIQHRLYREHCHVTAEGMHVKDLRVINRKETDIVLIDNAAYSYAFQLDNGIPIVPYYEGKNDYELRALQTYLQRLMWVPDVREVNKKVFKIHQYKNFEDPQTLVEELYTEWIV